MGSAERPRSAFQPATKPPGEPHSPFAPSHQPSEPPDPRLGIAHLLVGTACVALCLGLEQTGWRLLAHAVDQPERDVAFLEVMSFVLAPGAGPALGGLLLWVARSLRGMRFPRHPGEYLLVVQGILSVLSMGLGLLFPVLLFALGQALMLHFWGGIFFLFRLVGALVWLLAGRWIGIRGWRTFCFLCAGAQLLCCSGFGPLSPFVVGYSGLDVLISGVLIAIVVKEHRRGQRYPWTHWLGIAIWLWFALLNVLSFLIPLLWFVRYW